MAINPLLTNSTLPTVITEHITRLLAQLPQSVQIPATIQLSENSTLLKILSGSVGKPTVNQQNILKTTSNQTITKPILVQIPQINLPTLLNLKTVIPIVVTILQKLPVLKLQLSLLESIPKNQVTSKQRTQQTTISTNSPKPTGQKSINTTPLVEVTFNAKLTAQVKLLTQQIPIKQLQQLINLSKSIRSDQTPKKAHIANKNNPTTSVNSTLGINQQSKINTPQIRSTTAIIWPQHAALEKLSQALITTKLLQLNQQLPVIIKDPFVKVFQNWIKQLANTTANPKFLEQFLNHSKITSNKEIKTFIKQHAPLWEATVRKQINQTTSPTKQPQPEAVSNNNVKAQLLKIIQSLPVILARLDPATAAKVGIPETEIWQMIFKIRQLIQQQTHTAIPTSGNLNPPELAFNFIEQNLRLLIIWLKNIEQQQSEQHQRQQSPQQQSSSQSTNNLRFELPMPASSNSEMVQVEVEQYKKNKSKNKNQWKWKLKIQFDFGNGKKLITKTHVNPKQALIQFEGSNHYADLITPDSMGKLAQNLENKTGLDCNVEFNLSATQTSSKSTQSFNLKV